MRALKQFATCHPDIALYARELCKSCYVVEFHRPRWSAAKIKKAECHLDRGHYSRGMCKQCYVRKWQNENPEKTKAHRAKAWRKWYEITKKSTYTRVGLTAIAYTELLEKQSGLCSICLAPLIKPNVDHCHKTNRVRGLLCNQCNLGLGHFKDDANVLKRAAEYIITTSGEWR